MNTIVELTEQHFNIKAFVQNDANACAMAEWKYGAGRGYDNVAFHIWYRNGFRLDS